MTPSATVAAPSIPSPDRPDAGTGAGLDLATLAEELRLARFKVSLQQTLAAQQLLVRLAAQGQLPATSTQIAALLGPIFCTSPEDQSRFPGLFERWHRTQSPQPTPPPIPQPARERRRRSSSRAARPLRPWLGAFAGLLALVLAVLAWDRWRERTLEGRVLDATQPPLPLAGVDVASPRSRTRSDAQGFFRLVYRKSQLPVELEFSLTNFESVRRTLRRAADARIGDLALSPMPAATDVARTPSAGSEVWTAPTASRTAILQAQVLRLSPSPEWRDFFWGCIPLGLAMLWTWRHRQRHRPVLERLRSGTPAVLRDLQVAGAIRNLFPSLPVRQLAREMRRRRVVESRQLDVRATLAASLRRGGIFTPKYGARVEPDYLVLIDRADPSDHQARLADEIVASLEHGNVSVDRFFYDSDPRFCHPAPPRHQPVAGRRPPPTFALEELYARYPDHRVVVFTDGSGFFDPFTGEPSEWLPQLDRWTDRVLITPESPDRWARREAALQRLGYRVLPLNEAGLTAHTELLRGHPIRPFGTELAAVRPVPLFARNSRQWLDRLSPGPEVVSELCGELKVGFGDAGFAWLAACAIYPEIHWGLTVRLGFGLLDDEATVERLLPKLSRLVWFRYGFMPDWLREALLARVPPTLAAQSRALVLAILEQAGSPQREGVDLRVALPSVPTQSAGGGQRFWNAIVACLRLSPARRLANTARQAPADSPLRDQVFLRFAGGESTRGLATAAPSAWLRLLYPDGLPLHGLRLAPIWLLSLALAGFGAWLPWHASHQPVTTLAWSPDGAVIATGSADGRVRLWNATNGMALRAPLRHSAAVSALAFTPAGAQLAGGGTDGQVQVWNLRSGISTNLGVHSGARISALAFHPSQPEIAVASDSGAAVELGLWPVATNLPIQALVGRRGDPLRTLALVYDTSGQNLRAAYADGSVQTWNLPSHDSVHATSAIKEPPLAATLAGDGVRSVWLSATGGLLLRSDQEHPALGGANRFADLEGDDEPTRLLVQKAHPTGVVALESSPSGDRCLSVGRDHTLAVWSITSDRQTYVIQLANDPSRQTPEQNYGPVVANALRDARALAHVWEKDYGAGILRLENPQLEQVTNAFARLGRRVKSNDLVIVHLSGNATQGPQRDYRFLLGTQANAPWLGTAHLANFCRSLSAKEVLLMADSVYGETLVGRATSSFASSAGYGATEGPTRMALSSASAGQYASDGRAGVGSPFALALQRVLESPTPPATGTELYERVRRAMAEADRNNKDPQRPSYGPFTAGGHAGGDIHLPARLAAPRPPVTSAGAEPGPVTSAPPTNANAAPPKSPYAGPKKY